MRSRWLSVCVLRCIKELLKTAQEITELYNNGKKLGLSQEELAFYDALTKPENIKDFYRNNELIDLTRELTEMRRKNRTIDWQKKETARASMRKMVKHLLKKRLGIISDENKQKLTEWMLYAQKVESTDTSSLPVTFPEQPE